MIERWRAWIAAFDACCDDDGWDRLAPFLAEGVRYTVSGTSFACALSGRDAVIAGFAKSVRGFDQRLDERHWFGVGVRVYSPHIVTARSTGVYRRGVLPPLHFSAQSQWQFRDTLIHTMSDVYDPEEADVAAALQWLADHGQDLDPSYA